MKINGKHVYVIGRESDDYIFEGIYQSIGDASKEIEIEFSDSLNKERYIIYESTLEDVMNYFSAKRSRDRSHRDGDLINRYLSKITTVGESKSCDKVKISDLIKKLKEIQSEHGDLTLSQICDAQNYNEYKGFYDMGTLSVTERTSLGFKSDLGQFVYLDCCSKF